MGSIAERGKSGAGGSFCRNRSVDSLPEEIRTPAVFAEDTTAALRPLPGAFPTRRTLIFFDWDDTLCPTSWIRRLLTEHLAETAEWAMDNKDVDFEWRDPVPEWYGNPLPDDVSE